MNKALMDYNPKEYMKMILILPIGNICPSVANANGQKLLRGVSNYCHINLKAHLEKLKNL